MHAPCDWHSYCVCARFSSVFDGYFSNSMQFAMCSIRLAKMQHACRLWLLKVNNSRDHEHLLVSLHGVRSHNWLSQFAVAVTDFVCPNRFGAFTFYTHTHTYIHDEFCVFSSVSIFHVHKEKIRNATSAVLLLECYWPYRLGDLIGSYGGCDNVL